jgi:type I restriction enzyme, S subunit
MQKKQGNNKLSIFSDLVGQNGIFCDGDWIESKDQNKDGEVRLIQLSDIGDGFFRNKSNRFLTLKRAMELRCTFLEAGDVLIARMPDPLGRSCIFPLQGNEKFVTAVDVCILRVDGEISDNKFICHIINSPAFRNSINKLESGTTRKRISRKNLNTIEFLIPKISIQHQIVLKIEELFSELDKGKQQLQSALQLLKVYRQSLFKENFKGKRSISFDEYVESSQNGLSKRKGTTGEEFKVLRLADITNNMINDSDPRSILMDENEINKYKIVEEDLICVRVNGSKDLVGKLIHASNKNEKDNWAFCDHFIRFKLDSSKAYAKFFHYYFSTLEVRKYIQENMVTSAGQNTVSQVTIKNVMVPDFSKDEQVNIVKELESKFSLCNMIEETLNRSLRLSESLKQSILKQAFEGKLI